MWEGSLTVYLVLWLVMCSLAIAIFEVVGSAIKASVRHLHYKKEKKTKTPTVSDSTTETLFLLPLHQKFTLHHTSGLRQ